MFLVLRAWRVAGKNERRFSLFFALEREEAEEKARKEKEEKEREYREKVAKLDELERKRRQREKEIAEKEIRGRPDSERDGPPRPMERDKDRWGPPRREVKDEKGSNHLLLGFCLGVRTCAA